MQPQTLVFYGIIGSGKGTQVKNITDFLKTKDGLETIYAGTGEGFRKLIESDNYTASIVKDYLSRGELVPDFLASSIVSNILTSSLTRDKNLITDGYPRTLDQSKVFAAR